VLAEAGNGAVRIEWKGETPHTAAALLIPPPDPEQRFALDEAKGHLRDAICGTGSRRRESWGSGFLLAVRSE
jgi:hypothetical protein